MEPTSTLMMSEKICYRFKKDFRMSIPVVSDFNIFWKYLELLDYRTGSLRKWQDICQLVASCGDEAKFLELYGKYRECIICYLTHKLSQTDYNTCNMSIKFPIDPRGYASYNIYNCENTGKIFLSLDLKSANFNALKWAGYLTDESWEDLVKNACPGISDEMLKYFVEAKYTRQVVFGKCNPKRTITIERHIIWRVRKKFEEFLQVYPEVSASCVLQNNDEIIYELSSEKFPAAKFEDFLKEYSVRATVFSFKYVTLNRKNSDRRISSGLLVRNLNTGELSWKCVPEHFMGIFEWALQQKSESESESVPSYYRTVNFDGALAVLEENLEVAIPD